MIVRFKGRHADDNARFFADELHGRCKPGVNRRELEITHATRLVADAPPRDESERLSRDEVIEFGSNGHCSALGTRHSSLRT